MFIIKNKLPITHSREERRKKGGKIRKRGGYENGGSHTQKKSFRLCQVIKIIMHLRLSIFVCFLKRIRFLSFFFFLIPSFTFPDLFSSGFFFFVIFLFFLKVCIYISSAVLTSSRNHNEAKVFSSFPLFVKNDRLRARL